jgi:type VI secretion system protein ImpM
MAWRDLFRKKDGGAVAVIPRPAPSPPILFGKLPAQRDFVRVGSARHGWFESWLEEGLEQVAAREGALPPGIARFLLAPGGEVLSGVFVPSRDAVGRDFPLAIFRCWPALPPQDPAATWHDEVGFCRHAAALAAEAPALPPEQVESAVAALARSEAEVGGPGEGALAGWRDPLRQIPALLALETAFGALAQGGPAHSLMTVTGACDAAARSEKNALGLTLELPAPDGALVSFWLALCHQRLHRPGVSETAISALMHPGRLVLALGAAARSPAPLVACCLGLLAGPRHWLGMSEDAGLRAQSSRKLPPGVKSQLESSPPASLIDLLGAFS